MKTGNLHEICKDLEYDSAYRIILKRKRWGGCNNCYVKVEEVNGIDVFVFYGKQFDYKPVQLSYSNTIADDWYIAEQQTDIDSDKLKKLLENATEIINKILENYK